MRYDPRSPAIPTVDRGSGLRHRQRARGPAQVSISSRRAGLASPSVARLDDEMMPEFATSYNAWRSTPFPEGSDIDEIDDMHAKLAYVDAMVAEALVAGAGSRGNNFSIPSQALSELHEVIEWSEERADVPVEVDQLRRPYRQYAGLLLSLIRLAAPTP